MDEFVKKTDITVYENKDMTSYCTYFNAILENFDEEPYSNLFLDDKEDEKYFLLDNIYDYINKDLLPIVLDKKSSKMFEKILERSTIVQILQVARQLFDPDYLEQLCFNRFASYSVEKIIKIFGFILNLNHSKFEVSKACTKHTNALTTLALEKTSDFISNPFANHILRELLKSLNKTQNEDLEKIVDAVYANVNFEWSQDPKLCALLQDILNINNAIADRFMTSCCSEIESKFKEWVFNQNASRLVENLVISVSKDNLTKIIDLIFAGNMLDLSKSDNAMYSVKHLLQRLENDKSYNIVESLFLELLEMSAYWSVLQSQHYSVAIKFLDYQSHYSTESNMLLIDHIIKIGKERDGNLFFNIIALNGEAPTIAGSLVLQHLFKNIDIKDSEIMVSLFELSKEIHLRLMTNNAASHIYDSLYNSSLVPIESKLRIYDSIILVNSKDFATDKYGCRVIEASWNSLDMIRKLALMEMISQSRNDLVKSPHGRKFAKFTSIDAYRQDPHNWRRIEVGKMRNINIFKNVIGNKNNIKKQTPKQHVAGFINNEPIHVKTNRDDLDPIMDAIKGNNDASIERKRKKKSLKSGIKKTKTNEVFEVEILE
eukprot:NODE_176_length_15869_cov_0.275777.p2 type:complete len:601 gc:universal NODE_176_length_15869_cov_0.275777:8213-6411(-)